jgi:hypothetical protein
MKYKITKLDKRHSSHKIMKYHIEVTYDIWGSKNRVAQFMVYRNWCWKTFGPGVERKWIMLRPGVDGMESINSWAWHTEHEEMRLYLKSDAELTLFNLKFTD